MQKLKSNDLHAPLQFISPYTPEQCVDRLEAHFANEDDGLVFTVIDDTLTEFNINYRDGSRCVIVNGSLKTWAVGEQTRVICQAQSTKEINWTVSILAYGILLIITFAIFYALSSSNGFLFFLLFLLFFLVFLLLDIITERDPLIEFLTNVADAFYPGYVAPPENTRTKKSDNAKAESQFYDRLIALLAEPESA